MAFAIYAQQTNDFHTIILEDKIGLTRVAILPAIGGMLYSFEVQTNNGLFNIIDNYPDSSVLERDLSNSFKSCKLSPFACRIPGGRYVHNDHVYNFKNTAADGAAIHGLLYNKSFKVLDEFYDDTRASVLLKYSYDNEDEGFPFEYRCEVKYTLMPQSVLQIETTVVNLSDGSIPMADGWHPYFTLGGKIDEWLLTFNASSMLEFNDHLVPTGRVLPYKLFNEPTSLKGIELDSSFVLNKEREYAACTLLNPSNNLSISFFPDASYPYLQIYTPPGRNSIAIENLSGAPDCFNNKMGLTILPPRVSKTFTVYYKTNTE